MRKNYSLIGGVVLRATRVDSCGRVQYGPHARLVTEGFVSAEFSAEVNETDGVDVSNANGKIVARRRSKQQLSGFTGSIELVGVHPDLIEFLTGNPVVVNGRGDVAGVDIDVDIDPSQYGAAIEMWSELGDSDGCDDGAQGEYGYMLLPILSGGTVGDVEVGADAINFTIENAATKKGHAWGEGPYVVDVDRDGVPAPLPALSSSVALRSVVVGLAPPAETNGAIPLDNPDAVPSTSASAGSPGTFSPAGSNRPETLAEMSGVTASPTSAWTTGQYVVLQSGDEVHWTGTAWAAGRKQA